VLVTNSRTTASGAAAGRTPAIRLGCGSAATHIAQTGSTANLRYFRSSRLATIWTDNLDMSFSRVARLPVEGAPIRTNPVTYWRIGPLRCEMSALVLCIVLANLPLLHGTCAVELIFLPSRVAAGEWWRVFTHFFVHVSWYHLLLDAPAFLMLYQGLDKRQWFERLGYLLACGAGSVLVSLYVTPMVQTHGLCGLSGIAHGLMAISALDVVTTATDKTVRRAGILTLVVVLLKSIIEAATGHVVFEALHFGALGTPIAVCHAGGVLGGLIVWMLARRADTIPRTRRRRD